MASYKYSIKVFIFLFFKSSERKCVSERRLHTQEKNTHIQQCCQTVDLSQSTRSLSNHVLGSWGCIEWPFRYQCHPRQLIRPLSLTEQSSNWWMTVNSSMRTAKKSFQRQSHELNFYIYMKLTLYRQTCRFRPPLTTTASFSEILRWKLIWNITESKTRKKLQLLRNEPAVRNFSLSLCV